MSIFSVTTNNKQDASSAIVDLRGGHITGIILTICYDNNNDNVDDDDDDDDDDNINNNNNNNNNSVS